MMLPAKDTGQIPALTQHTFLRYLNFIALYVAQGLPEGMLLFGLPAWMAMNGKTPGEIGTFAAVAGLPWSFKIVVAPLMDRFSFLPMGRRRPWVLLGQLGLISSFIAMAFVHDPLNHLGWFMAAAFSVSFFGAFQDVATDGMAIDVVPVNQQARANGFMWGAKIMGTSLSLATGSWMLHQYGYKSAILILSAGVAIIMMAPLLLRERQGERLLPWTKGKASPENLKIQSGNWKTILQSLYKAFALRNSLLFAALAFVIAGSFNYIETLMPIFTVQALGWSDRAYANFFATASLTGGIGGMLLAGFMLDRFGKNRMIKIYLLAGILLIGCLVGSKSYWSSTRLVSSFMIAEQVLYVFTTVGVFAMGMQCCWRKVSATQFCLYMTISNMGRITGAKMIGLIKSHFNWEITLGIFGLLMLAAWVLIGFLNVDAQQKTIAAFDKHTLRPAEMA